MVEAIGSNPIGRSIPGATVRPGCCARYGSFTVCRLARSKSSALGAEDRRFKSCHTDHNPRKVGRAVYRTGPENRDVLRTRAQRFESSTFRHPTRKIAGVADRRCLLNRRSRKGRERSNRSSSATDVVVSRCGIDQLADRRAHNPKAARSSRAPATNLLQR